VDRETRDTRTKEAPASNSPDYIKESAGSLAQESSSRLFYIITAMQQIHHS